MGSDVAPELPTTVFVILRDLIHEHTGIYFENDRRDVLADKLAPHVVERGFASFLDYYYLLKYGPGSEVEWPNVQNALSVQETYFWREIGQIQAFVNTILPEYVANCSTRPVKIWCAACATGEEPLSIAMALEEAGWFSRVPLEIHATDASSTALAKARRGIYRERAFRTLPPAIKEKYFEEVDGGRKVSPALHARIQWDAMNLMDESALASRSSVPFIFCRNVFIYFSPEAIACTVNRMAAAMPRPGYLFVGASESLMKLTDAFELRDAGEAFVYALRGDGVS